jgi:hypothetical protein
VIVSASLLAIACGGPSAPLPKPRGHGGSGGVASSTIAAGATTIQTSAVGGSATRSRTDGAGGIVSTYTDPGCPSPVEPKIDAECMVLDQTSCPAGEGCYPTITYPTALCEPETFGMTCFTAGDGVQWDECKALTDCAPGYICVVGGLGTMCLRACDSSDPTSCPKGLFCDAIDLPGIGTCY